MDNLTLFGSFGALVILFAFAMNQFHKWKDTYFIYDLFNFIGGVILVTYALILNSYPFALLNSVWAILSLRDIYLDFQRNLKTNGLGRKKTFYSRWFK